MQRKKSAEKIKLKSVTSTSIGRQFTRECENPASCARESLYPINKKKLASDRKCKC